MCASDRYARQIALPGFGEPSQQALAAARVLVIGAGGLGSPVITALAAAGVGALGIVDDDRVELSNLHRQTIHTTADIDRDKVASAADSVRALNPDVTVDTFAERLSAHGALELFAGYDLVIDGSDNFPTRYVAADAAALRGIPLVWGAVSQYAGQVGVSWPGDGPGYRDLFPVPAPPGTVLSCAEGGVLPTVVGVIGALMATEAIKILTGVGDALIGRVVVFDALTASFREIPYARDPRAVQITAVADDVTAEDAVCAVVGAVDVSELASMSPSAITLLDVREPWEAEIASIPGSVLVPLGSLAEALESGLPELDPTKPVIAYCHHGIRSQRAGELLAAAGYDAHSLDRGIDAWSLEIDDTTTRY